MRSAYAIAAIAVLAALASTASAADCAPGTYTVKTPGMGTETVTCEDCVAGAWCPGGPQGNAPIYPCPAGTTSPPKSTKSSDCVAVQTPTATPTMTAVPPQTTTPAVDAINPLLLAALLSGVANERAGVPAAASSGAGGFGSTTSNVAVGGGGVLG